MGISFGLDERKKGFLIDSALPALNGGRCGTHASHRSPQKRALNRFSNPPLIH
jgi:hypothetical protein